MNYVEYLTKTHYNKNAESLARWYKLSERLKLSGNKGNNLLADAYMSAIIWILKMKNVEFVKEFNTYRRIV